MKTTLHVVVTTLDRGDLADPEKDADGPFNYLEYTLDSLMRHGGCQLLAPAAAKITVFDGGSAHDRFLSNAARMWKDVEFARASRRLSIVENTMRALRSGAQNSEYVCLVQDDVCFAWWTFLALPGWLQRHKHLDFAYVSLTRVPGRIHPDHAECFPESTPNACCLVFRSSTLSGLFAHPVRQGWDIGYRVDHMLRRWALALNRPVISPLKSWVQHVGDHSTIANRPVRRSRLYDPAPVVSLRDIRTTLPSGTGMPGHSRFTTLFPGGTPSRNRHWHLIETENGCAISRSFQELTLNPTAQMIWHLCSGHRSYNTIIGSLARYFVVPREEIIDGVDECLFELIDRRALCVGRDTPALGVTRLMKAAANDDTSTERILARKHCDLNAVDSLNRTALHYAAESGNPKMYRLLRQFGARADVVDHLGRTPTSIREESNSMAP